MLNLVEGFSHRKVASVVIFANLKAGKGRKRRSVFFADVLKSPVPTFELSTRKDGEIYLPTTRTFRGLMRWRDGLEQDPSLVDLLAETGRGPAVFFLETDKDPDARLEIISRVTRNLLVRGGLIVVPIGGDGSIGQVCRGVQVALGQNLEQLFSDSTLDLKQVDRGNAPILIAAGGGTAGDLPSAAGMSGKDSLADIMRHGEMVYLPTIGVKLTMSDRSIRYLDASHSLVLGTGAIVLEAGQRMRAKLPGFAGNIFPDLIGAGITTGEILLGMRDSSAFSATITVDGANPVEWTCFSFMMMGLSRLAGGVVRFPSIPAEGAIMMATSSFTNTGVALAEGMGTPAGSADRLHTLGNQQLSLRVGQRATIELARPEPAAVSGDPIGLIIKAEVLALPGHPCLVRAGSRLHQASL